MVGHAVEEKTSFVNTRKLNYLLACYVHIRNLMRNGANRIALTGDIMRICCNDVWQAKTYVDSHSTESNCKAPLLFMAFNAINENQSGCGTDMFQSLRSSLKDEFYNAHSYKIRIWIRMHAWELKSLKSCLKSKLLK